MRWTRSVILAPFAPSKSILSGHKRGVASRLSFDPLSPFELIDRIARLFTHLFISHFLSFLFVLTFRFISALVSGQSCCLCFVLTISAVTIHASIFKMSFCLQLTSQLFKGRVCTVAMCVTTMVPNHKVPFSRPHVRLIVTTSCLHKSSRRKKTRLVYRQCLIRA